MKLTMPWNAAETHRNGIGGKLDDVRSALSDQADHVAAVAAEIGRDIAETAANVTHDAGKVTGKVAHDAGVQAASVTQDVQSGAGALARKVAAGAAGLGAAIAASGRNAQDLGKDARKVRLTTQPAKSGPDLMAGVALLGGFSAGTAVMYFLDPEQGRRRRALFREQLTKWARVGRDAAKGRAKDLRNRSAGVMHETRKAVVGVTGQSAPDADTSMYAPTGYGSGLDIEQPSVASGPGPSADYGLGSASGQGSELGQPSELSQSGYEEQGNRNEGSRIEVG